MVFLIRILLHTTVQKFEITVILFLKKLILLFSKDSFNCSKVTIKMFTLFKKIQFLNKLFCFELYSHQILEKKSMIIIVTW